MSEESIFGPAKRRTVPICYRIKPESKEWLEHAAKRAEVPVGQYLDWLVEQARVHFENKSESGTNGSRRKRSK